MIWPIVGFKKWHKDARDGKDYDHLASWIKRLADCSPVCKQIAQEAAEVIV